MAINPLAALGGAAGTFALQRTYLLETETPTGVPRVLIVFDAITEEKPEYTADVTQHPVEDGPEITDHIQLKNPTLSLVGTISATPIDLSVSMSNIVAGGLSTITSSQFRSNVFNSGLQSIAGVGSSKLLELASGGITPGSAAAGSSDAIARSALMDAYERRARFNVITKRHQYQSMVIRSLSFPRDSQTGKQVLFELEMVRIRVVSAFTVQIGTLSEGVVNSASPVASLGTQVGKGVNSNLSASAAFSLGVA